MFSISKRCLSTVPRVVDMVDLCIVGGGPAGLATAIRFKQLDRDDKYRVVVLEKGAEFGSHTLSGVIIEPRALKELVGMDNLPRDLLTEVKSDEFQFLTSKYKFPMPLPETMHNTNKNFVGSLSQVVKWLSEQAESLGVELYNGVSVSDIIYNKDKTGILGIATKDLGISKEGKEKDTFERGLEFHARQTVLAEGCHGSITKKILKKFDLRKDRGPQTYGLGIKEVWKVMPDKFRKGHVAHTMGYPLSKDLYGGGFQYHFGDGLVTVGLVIGLDYENPYVSPYQEFQKMKHHPFYSKVLEGGKCISYGARALNEGGIQAIPKLNFPGGVLVGASAGFMNVPKIKGSHTAMKSGMLAAETIFDEVSKLPSYSELINGEEELTSETVKLMDEGPLINLVEYPKKLETSWVYEELKSVRNIRPSFNTKLGLYGGMVYSGIDSIILKGRVPWTFQYKELDSKRTKHAKDFEPIVYPKPDGKISFDIMTSVSRTGTYHDEDEQCHLRVGEKQDLQKHTEEAYPKWKGIEERFCPAGVYEYVKDSNSPLGVKFKINSQNCIHCKTCDIKVPTQDINWVVPEGGDGPKYFNT